MSETGGVPVKSITDMNPDVIDYVQSIVTVDKSGGVPHYQWSHKLSGTVNVSVVDALATQHAAQSANRDQLRAAEATLGLLEPHVGKPASAESEAAMAEARPILDSLGTTASDLGQVVQWLRQKKIPGLYAERTRIGQNTRAEAGWRSGVDRRTAEKAGDAYRDADLQEWASNAAQARRDGDFETAAHYERRAAAWNDSKAAAEETLAADLSRLAKASTAPNEAVELAARSADLTASAGAHRGAATAHAARVADDDARAAVAAAEHHTVQANALERAGRRGAAEAGRLYRVLREMAALAARDSLRWSMDY